MLFRRYRPTPQRALTFVPNQVKNTDCDRGGLYMASYVERLLRRAKAGVASFAACVAPRWWNWQTR